LQLTCHFNNDNHMKKIALYLFSMLAVIIFTACGNDDEPINKQTINLTFNALYIPHGEDAPVVFSQSSGQAEIEYTSKMTLRFNCCYKRLDGTMVEFKSQHYELEHYQGSVYYLWKRPGGINQIGTRPGLIDLSTGMIWYQENNIEQAFGLILTTQFSCPYLTTTVIDENRRTVSHTRTCYELAIDSRCENAMMRVKDFVPETDGAIHAAILDYEGLSVKPVKNSFHGDIGYRITADHARCRQSAYYDLTDLEINLNLKGIFISGSYKIKGKTYKMSGGLFPVTDMNRPDDN